MLHHCSQHWPPTRLRPSRPRSKPPLPFHAGTCRFVGRALAPTEYNHFHLMRYNKGGYLDSRPHHIGCSHFFFRRPLLRRASLIIHCNCPFVLRNSSAAHASIADIVSPSILRTKLLALLFLTFLLFASAMQHTVQINDSEFLN